ncbi:DUF6233 domain-containing protein [Streptomyces sp. NPDC055036]
MFGGSGAGPVCFNRQATDEAGWVLQALPAAKQLLLHRTGCWTAAGRLTPANTAEAKTFVKHGWATACDVCKPAP